MRMSLPEIDLQPCFLMQISFVILSILSLATRLFVASLFISLSAERLVMFDTELLAFTSLCYHSSGLRLFLPTASSVSQTSGLVRNSNFFHYISKQEARVVKRDTKFQF